MDRFFECPDCNARHDEPADAGFALVAICLDCDLERRYLEAARVREPLRRAA